MAQQGGASLSQRPKAASAMGTIRRQIATQAADGVSFMIVCYSQYCHECLLMVIVS
jgi:hypothetical protein